MEGLNFGVTVMIIMIVMDTIFAYIVTKNKRLKLTQIKDKNVT
jgi:hypothetical protein